MAKGKRTRTADNSLPKAERLSKSDLEDKETSIVMPSGDDSFETETTEKVKNVDKSDDEGESTDSSVYSELEESEDEEEESGSESESESESENSKEKDGEEKTKNDEYAYDSSDEEDIRNTVGNVPMHWYDEYDHLGYNLDGKKILKPKRGDELDNFLNKMDNANFGVTVFDPSTGEDVVLPKSVVETIRRLRSGKLPDPNYDMFSEWPAWFSSQVLDTPVRDLPESKKSFLPSVSEKKIVGRMVHAIKMGWMKPVEQKKPKTDPDDPDAKTFYMMWKTDDQVEGEDIRRIRDTIPAPKMRLPGHEESYNPPPEYLFTEQEKERWESQEDEPFKRKLPFVPQKHEALRKVPAYARFINERFERCLDLYLAPRARKMRLTIQPEDLVPQLPKPQDLQPFPQVCAMTYKGHKNMIRTLSMEPKGQYIASGSDDGTVKIWEVQTGYCAKTFFFGKTVIHSVAWCPNTHLSVIAVAVDSKVVLINAGVGDKLVVDQTDELLKEAPADTGYVPPERVKNAVTWASASEAEAEDNTGILPKGSLIVLKMFREVKQVIWHGKGDYFATVLPQGQNRSVLIHQMSKWQSQVPFNKPKGTVQCVIFHPVKPFLFVATMRHVRIYDLSKQDTVKTLKSGAKWISSIAIHPFGDNLLVGTYDKKVQWYDLDLSTRPYQVLRYHTNAVRGVAYHLRYPLFASCSDDTSIVVSHGMVYNDYNQNPLIVPVKQLRGHTKYDDFGVMALTWHPHQPWLFSAGADGYIKLWN